MVTVIGNCLSGMSFGTAWGTIHSVWGRIWVGSAISVVSRFHHERGQYTFTIVTVRVIAIITKPILLLSTFSVCRQIFQENNFIFFADEAPTTKAHPSKHVCNT